MSRRKSYSLAFKLKLLQEVENTSTRKVSTNYKISRRVLRAWLRQKTKIKDTMYRTRRRVERPRVSPFDSLEGELYAWITERRSAGQVVDGNGIREQARQIAIRMEIRNFKCSAGWFWRFLKRMKLRLRRVTTSGRELPKNGKDTVLEFISTCSNHIVNNQVPLSEIYNMDQTSVYLDSFCKQKNFIIRNFLKLF